MRKALQIRNFKSIFNTRIIRPAPQQILKNHHGVTYTVEDVTHHRTEELTDQHFSKISRLDDLKHLREAVQNICIERVVGSRGHEQVREYITSNLRDLQWHVEIDKFHQSVPILGKVHFQNIIATLNPKAERYLVLACHYDSKYFAEFKFVGATDSAVPCAMLLNLAKVMQNELNAFRDAPLSLMLIFFDGEEAFEEWSATDSIYGAKHLAEKWEKENLIDRLDMLVLLDLIGAPDPKFYSFFKNTESWYSRLINIEDRLSDSGHLEHYTSSGVSRPKNPNRYFQPNAWRSSFIEDDHLPFLKREVPILHIIPVPFPTTWHTQDDNESSIDYATTQNMGRIIRLFTMEFLLGKDADRHDHL